MEFLLCYPFFRKKAVTFSYDDGVIQDREVIRILKAHSLKGTFNLNYGMSGKPKLRKDIHGTDIDCSHLVLEDSVSLYEGMEIANHTLTHPHLEGMDSSLQMDEFVKGKRKLEELFHREVYGAAYPYGTYDKTTLDLEKSLGVEYSRTTRSTYDFSLPYNWLLWNPTIHHRDKRMKETLMRFVSSERELALLYIWGHGYEFAIDRNFDLLDDICTTLNEHQEDIICLTNHEIYTYVNAACSVYYSRLEKAFVNPSGCDVYLICDGNRIVVPKKGLYRYENAE